MVRRGNCGTAVRAGAVRCGRDAARLVGLPALGEVAVLERGPFSFGTSAPRLPSHSWGERRAPIGHLGGVVTPCPGRPYLTQPCLDSAVGYPLCFRWIARPLPHRAGDSHHTTADAHPGSTIAPCTACSARDTAPVASSAKEVKGATARWIWTDTSAYGPDRYERSSS